MTNDYYKILLKEDKNLNYTELYEEIIPIISDPDDDGNYPILVNKKKYLIIGKIKNIKKLK